MEDDGCPRWQLRTSRIQCRAPIGRRQIQKSPPHIRRSNRRSLLPRQPKHLCYKYVHVTPLQALALHGFKKEKASLALLARQTGAELQQMMASTIMAATSRVVAAKTPFLGQGRAAANASPLRDVAAAASGRINMVRNVRRGGPWHVVFQSIR